MPTSPPPAQQVSLAVVLAGAPFEHPAVLEAVGLGVPWADLAASLFAGQEVVFLLEVQDEQYRLATEVGYDPEAAKQLMAEAGYPSYELIVMATTGDPSLEPMMEETAAALASIGVEIESVVLVPREDGYNILATKVAAGQAVLWLDRR
jgi:ABC-type transport system substrate-binding protein